MTAGAICGGARYVLRTEPEPERWCYGERKRRTGTHELRSENPADITGIPIEELSWYEPVWVYKCDGCGEDRRWMW